MRIVLEHTWQVVIEVADEYSSKDHIEFAYNEATHCSSNNVEELRVELRKRYQLDEDVDPLAEANEDDIPCACDWLVTRWVRPAEDGEAVGLVTHARRYDRHERLGEPW